MALDPMSPARQEDRVKEADHGLLGSVTAT